MKKLIVLLLFIPLVSFGQDTIPAIKLQPLKEAWIDKMQELKTEYKAQERFVIYPTENMYVSLLLDTQTGKIWQVQIGVGDTVAGRAILSDRSFKYTKREAKQELEEALKSWDEDTNEDKDDWKPNIDWYPVGVVGQFKLYPTQNMYNFIMVDVVEGWAYQVQWHPDEEKRMINLIYKSLQ